MYVYDLTLPTNVAAETSALVYSDICKAWKSASADSHGNVREVDPFGCHEFLNNLSRVESGTVASR